MRKLLTTMMTTLLAFSLVACGPEEGGSGGEGSGGGPTTSIVFDNQSSVAIYYLYLSGSGSSSWGPDQLGSSVLTPGRAFRLNGVPCGRTYDFRLEDLGHRELLTRYGMFVGCGAPYSVVLH